METMEGSTFHEAMCGFHMSKFCCVTYNNFQTFLALEAAFFPEVVLRVVGMGLQDHNFLTFRWWLPFFAKYCRITYLA